MKGCRLGTSEELVLHPDTKERPGSAHRKYICHAIPHRCENGEPRDAGEGVQGAVDASLVTGEGRNLGIHWWVEEPWAHFLNSDPALPCCHTPLLPHCFLLSILFFPG